MSLPVKSLQAPPYNPEGLHSELGYHTLDGSQVRTEVLGELHPPLPLLPELDMAVGAAGDEEFGGLCHLHVRHGVAVHVAALVHLGAGQPIQMGGLKFQDLHIPSLEAYTPFSSALHPYPSIQALLVGKAVGSGQGGERGGFWGRHAGEKQSGNGHLSSSGGW